MQWANQIMKQLRGEVKQNLSVNYSWKSVENWYNQIQHHELDQDQFLLQDLIESRYSLMSYGILIFCEGHGLHGNYANKN